MNSLSLVWGEEEKSAPLTDIMEGRNFQLELGDKPQKQIPMLVTTASPFKNPQCCLKPITAAANMMHFPKTVLDGDFQALANRTGSTSTPFVTRTTSGTSVTQLTPSCFSESSLNDSAIETTYTSISGLKNHLSMKNSLGESVFAKKSDRFATIAEDEPGNCPKAVLFPQSCSDCIQSSVESHCSEKNVTKWPTKDQCVPCSTNMDQSYCVDAPCEQKPSFASDISMLEAFRDVRPKVHQDTHSSHACTPPQSAFETDSTPFNFSHSTKATPDTGYESQLGFESSSDTSFSLCLSQFAPKHPDRLIGRKMGLDYVDIITQLNARNLHMPLNMILRQLNKQDLKNMCAVSADWNHIVYSDMEARRKVSPRTGSRKINPEKENCHQKKRKESRDLTSPTRTMFSVLQPIAPPQPSTSTSPVSSEAQQALVLSKKYWKQADQLKNEEYLKKCPKCSSPAKVNPTQERAWCSNDNCTFDFCIKCHGNFHGSKDCGLKVTIKKQKTSVTVGSKRSKKNLRRL